MVSSQWCVTLAAAGMKMCCCWLSPAQGLTLQPALLPERCRRTERSRSAAGTLQSQHHRLGASPLIALSKVDISQLSLCCWWEPCQKRSPFCTCCALHLLIPVSAILFLCLHLCGYTEKEAEGEFWLEKNPTTLSEAMQCVSTVPPSNGTGSLFIIIPGIIVIWATRESVSLLSNLCPSPSGWVAHP